MPEDKLGRPIELRDYDAKEIVGVQIGQRGHKLWVCIDGVAVLRVKSPRIDLKDMRTPAARAHEALAEAEAELERELRSITPDPNNVTGDQVSEVLSAIARADLPMESLERVTKAMTS